jgi:leucyl-tRNA synthetase
VPSNADAPAIERAALASKRVQAILAGRTPDRVIQAVGGRLVNVVVRE